MDAVLVQFESCRCLDDDEVGAKLQYARLAVCALHSHQLGTNRTCMWSKDRQRSIPLSSYELCKVYPTLT